MSDHAVINFIIAEVYYYHLSGLKLRVGITGQWFGHELSVLSKLMYLNVIAISQHKIV